MKKPFITKNALHRIGKLSFSCFLIGFTLSSCDKYLDYFDNKDDDKKTARLYVSNATLTNTLNIYDPADQATLDTPKIIQTDAKDGNGVAISTVGNILFQVGRKDRIIKLFSNASSLSGSPTPLNTFADSAMTSGREIAYDEERQILYVANNTDSTILVYNNPLLKNGLVTADKKLKLSGQPWSVHYDRANNRLFVLLDLAARTIEVYQNPFNLASGAVTPNRSFKIAGATRLHGITYSSKSDVLIVTEIGAATAAISSDFASDGGIYIFENAKNIITGSAMEVSPTRTIKGTANTSLGNPVDVAFDDRNGKKNIYIAEKANKKILVFKLTDSGDINPKISVSSADSPEAVFLDLR